MAKGMIRIFMFSARLSLCCQRSKILHFKKDYIMHKKALECERYEEERICLRETIENITGLKVEEMDREYQIRVVGRLPIALSGRKTRDGGKLVRGFLEMWRVRCSAEENRRQMKGL